MDVLSSLTNFSPRESYKDYFLLKILHHYKFMIELYYGYDSLDFLAQSKHRVHYATHSLGYIQLTERDHAVAPKAMS